ncbi:methyltransferase-like protein 17 mitochondrial-like, partial [Trifolium medium]|nr:methyltransferase-like protein 17 mitochondrial-like [Trifolium medium]
RSALFGPPGEVVKSWAGMSTQTIAETALKIVTPETLRYAAKQSQRCLTVPLRLRRAIKKYLRGGAIYEEEGVEIVTVIQ